MLFDTVTNECFNQIFLVFNAVWSIITTLIHPYLPFSPLLLNIYFRFGVYVQACYIGKLCVTGDQVISIVSDR